MRPGFGEAMVLAALIATGPALGDTVLKGRLPVLGSTSGVTSGGQFTPAPTPNQDLYAPPDRSTDPLQPKVGAQLTQPSQTIHDGQGYAPGSSFSDDVERRNRNGVIPGFAPTLSLKVPIK